MAAIGLQAVPPGSQDLPAWFIGLGVAAVLVLVWLLWRARGSMRDSGRSGFPDDPPSDTSEYQGPRSGLRTFLGVDDDPGHQKPRDDGVER